jgi:NitT/TauT family transport system permease protein
VEVRVADTHARAAAQERAPARRRPVVRLKREISDRRRRLLVILSLVVPLTLWFVLNATHAVSALFLPSPASVVRAGWKLASSGLLGHDILATVRRVGIGFGLVVLVSVPLGIAMGTLPSVRAIFEPMIGLVRYMPAPAFIPLLIIWLGLGEGSKIALLFIGTLFFNTLMTADVAEQVPKPLIDVSYTLGAGRWTVFRKVILPHSMPGIINAMRVNIAATWNLVVVAELIAAQEGLGYRITRAQRFLQTDQIFAVLIVIGVIGVLIDVSFRLLRRAVSPWAE